MSDKLVAGIVTAAGIAPICAVCIVGPAAIGSMMAGVFGWLGGSGLLLTVAFMAAAGLLTYRTLCRRYRQNQTMTSADHQRSAYLPVEAGNGLRPSEGVPSIRSAQKGGRP